MVTRFLTYQCYGMVPLMPIAEVGREIDLKKKTKGEETGW